jgi:1,2-diacylglycerol 3-beta-glucosyltransferase
VILQIIAILLLIPASFIAGYYIFLALVGLISRSTKNIQSDSSGHSNRFAIIVPAHDEENTILKTIDSCKNIDYPEDKYDVYVIADNCTDHTEKVVLDNGTKCLARNIEELRGKGHALAWAFDKLSEDNFDAFVIVDADCEIDSNSLSVFDQYISNGDLVLQANDVSANPDDSAMSYAVTVGNVIENDLFYVAKDVLGLPVQLRGTGMVLTKKILQQYPWTADSIVEDMEYSLNLLKNGVRIRFVKETKVSSDFPIHKEQLDVQRTRWAGNLSFGKKDAIKLMVDGFRKKSLTLIDLGLSFLVLSRPLVLAELILAIIASTLCLLFSPGAISTHLFIASLVILSIQIIYFGTGILLLGLNAQRIKFLLTSPIIVFRLALISIKGMLKFGENNWSRTPRDS